MADDHIRYDILAQEALLGVVRKVLAEVNRTGLPGEHHFYIAFDTNAENVRISDRIHAEYPEEMTIVLQHQFWDLEVTDTGFGVGLSFQGIPEKLWVPYTAIRGFFDPSVQFGLQFEPLEGEDSFLNRYDPEADEHAPLRQAPQQATPEKTASPLLKEVSDEPEATGDMTLPKADDHDADEEQTAADEEHADTAMDVTDPVTEQTGDATDNTETDEKTESADVVSLDAFRKKK